MFPNMTPWLKLLLAALVAFIIAYISTPPVKKFAEKVGAIDKPDERRVNKVPIPRMGGIAIFFGFMVALLLFVEMDQKIRGIIIGALIIAVMGGVDDIVNLNPWVKLILQIVAGLVVIRCGVVFDGISNFSLGSTQSTIYINNDWLSTALTLLWIVGCTNAVNLIDGLDGLAVGVSAISSVTMMIVSIMVSDINVTIILACLSGACLGFLPYNKNPASIFMGDVGSQLLGFVLASASALGLFKLHAIITFLVPLMALAVPLADTIFAFFRRILHGQSPFHADKGHFHHRLLASGLDQKQAVAVLYGISAILGLFAVLMTGSDPVLKIICIIVAFLIALSIWLFVFRKNPHLKSGVKEDEEDYVKIYDSEKK